MTLNEWKGHARFYETSAKKLEEELRAARAHIEKLEEEVALLRAALQRI